MNYKNKGVKMKFYEVQPALETGTAIRRAGRFPISLKNGKMVIISFGHDEPIRELRVEDISADDWEIIEDIPEIKLQRSTESYYECPKCKRTDSVIIYIENVNNNDTLHECRFCGQKFNLMNLKEAYEWGTLTKNDLRGDLEEILKSMVQNAPDILTFNNQGKITVYEVKKRYQSFTN